mmetsp:Transcript_20356/g.48296  ORF Transcript_20356/g.48296 Transcript_20356/m.48296 type:complete len:141 (-) Transcript_20356:215-637(-)
MGGGVSKMVRAYKQEKKVTVMGQEMQCVEYCPSGQRSQLVSLQGVGVVNIIPERVASGFRDFGLSSTLRSLRNRPLALLNKRSIRNSVLPLPQPGQQRASPPPRVTELRLSENKSPVCILVCEEIDDSVSPPKGHSWTAY